jgi:hypothetical protein
MADNYWDSVESIAREVIEQNGLDYQNWHDSIHENVDSSSWIIYYAKNEEVLDCTKNDPDNDEVSSMCNPKGSWRDMRQTAAFLAMECDVWEKCRELVDEYTPASFKLKKADGTYLKVGDVTPEGEDQQDDELSFTDLDDAEEAKENYETANKDKEVEVIAFNDDDNEIGIDLEVLR